MANVELRVKYVGGEPVEIRFGRGMMGETVSLASVKDDGEGVAVVVFDNAGSTDFVRAVKQLPFVDDVIESE